MIGETNHEQVYTLKGADHAYQLILETINEGAVTISADSMILYCNPAFARLLQAPLEQIVGSSLTNFAWPP